MKPVIIISSITIVALFFIASMFPQESFAQSQNQIGTLNIEKNIYEIPYSEKVPVKISGNIKYPVGSEMVTLSITDPDNNSNGIKIVPSSNGNFEFIINFDSNSIKGTYSVMGSYKGKIFETISFILKDKQPTIEEILKARGERITTIEETPITEPELKKPIPKDVTPTDNQKHVPNFADPAKDPQYYLDRYYNEDNYKAWFDRNYPDYTIEKAVGFVPKSLVPQWVKNISLWFGEGKIAETEFLDAVSFLIKNNIMQSQEKLQDKGNFKVVYDKTTNQNYMKIENKLKQSKFFEKISKDLNSKLNLPNNIIVNIKKCDVINAFYDRESDTIIMCYEMYEYLVTLFSSVSDDKQVVLGYVDGVMEFFFLHELGHALIDVYDIPITGMEEDAVDQLAAIVLLQKGNDGLEALVATAGFFGLHGVAITDVNELTFADEHSLDLQRYYNMLCFAYGSNVNEYQILINQNILPVERSIQCIDEYSKISKSRNTLLAPYEKSTSFING